MMGSIRDTWEESIQLAPLNTRCVLYPHYNLIGLSLHRMFHRIGVLEFVQGTNAGFVLILGFVISC
jgi:hypothetical protein